MDELRVLRNSLLVNLKFPISTLRLSTSRHLVSTPDRNGGLGAIAVRFGRFDDSSGLFSAAHQSRRRH